MHRVIARSVASSLVVVALLGGVWGCGGASGSGDRSPVDLSSLPPAPELGIFVRVKAASGEAQDFSGNVQSALTTSMSNAGYKLITSEDGHPDVVANITVSATEETSLFAMQVNGKVQKNYKVTVNAAFIAAGDASVIDQTTTEFSGKDGNIEQNAIDKILVHLGKTGKLSSYAINAKAKIEQAEDDLWKAANVEGCKNPTSKDACKGVEDYIAKYPTGKYTADGRQAMQDGEAARNKAAEEEVWAAASVETCLKPSKSYDCKAIEEYIKKYPTGAHVAEGKEAMSKSDPARTALAKKEEANKKKESRENCIKNCRRAYESYRSFEVLAGRCIQTECS